MRFMMLMIPKGYEKAAPGAMPDAKAVAAMMKHNESLQKAGVLLALDGLHQFFVELPHGGEQLLAGHGSRLGLLIGLDYHHESHSVLSCWLGYSSRASGLDRLYPDSINASNKAGRNRHIQCA